MSLKNARLCSRARCPSDHVLCAEVAELVGLLQLDEPFPLCADAPPQRWMSRFRIARMLRPSRCSDAVEAGWAVSALHGRSAPALDEPFPHCADAPPQRTLFYSCRLEKRSGLYSEKWLELQKCFIERRCRVSEEPPVREPEGRVVSLVKVKVLLGNGLVKVKTLGEVGVV